MPRAASAFLALGCAAAALSAAPGAAQVVTFESIVAQLESADPALRRQALRLLANARYPEAAEPIATVITDEDDQLQLEAMAAELHLFLIDPPASSRRVGLVFEQRGRVPAETLYARGPLALGAELVPDAVFEALLTASRDATAGVAREALDTLAVLAPAGAPSAPWRARAAEELARGLDHADRGHRLAALRAVAGAFRPPPGDAAPEPIGAAVVLRMNDRQREVRVLAMQTLGVLRELRGVTSLLERFAHERRGREAEAALAALAAIGHPAAAPVFVDQLAGGSNERKRIAIEGLARTGAPAMMADLQRLARETDRELALAVSFAGARLANGRVDLVMGALLQNGLRVQAFNYLVELVGPRQASLVPYVQDPDAALRTMLADAAALSQDVRALPLVEAMRRDPHPEVAAAAARAVSWLERHR